jgi:hypothetical protein
MLTGRKVVSEGVVYEWVSVEVTMHTNNRISRVGAVALYTVLWTVVAKYRKWPFSAPHRTKTP